MAHHTYHTDSIILSSRPVGESNRYLSLLTRDLGLVRAVARASREGRSKLRYALQTYARATVSLVRGRETWRVVGAVSEGSALPRTLTHSAEVREIIARVARLVERLIPGEGGDPALFETVDHLASTVCIENERVTREVLASMECIAVLRILRSLGYLGDDAALDPFNGEVPLSLDAAHEFGTLRPRAIARINAALRATHL